MAWLLMVTGVLGAAACLLAFGYAFGVFTVAPRRGARRMAVTAARHAALEPVKVIRQSVVSDKRGITP